MRLQVQRRDARTGEKHFTTSQDAGGKGHSHDRLETALARAHEARRNHPDLHYRILDLDTHEVVAEWQPLDGDIMAEIEEVLS